MTSQLLKEVPDLTNTSLLDAIKGKNLNRPPVWLMRQAGRYMPSYQEFKKKYSLLQMFQEEDLITKITLLPIDELDVDAAILFSDILLPLQTLGYTLSYGKKGPKLSQDEVDFESVRVPSYQEIEDRLSFVPNSIKILKKELKVPLLGFSGAPFTLASYLLEKENHHLLKETKKCLYQNPKRFHKMLDVLCEITISYLKLQVEAGVDAIQIFDSWAGALDTYSFDAFVVKYLKRIIEALKPYNVPIIVFCRGSCIFVEELISLSPSVISFDWQMPLEKIVKMVPKSIGIQGNLDPEFLQGDRAFIKHRVQDTLEIMKDVPRYIFNLGHGLLPNTPYENVRYLVDLIKSY